MMESLVSESCKAERELCAAILKGTIKAADVRAPGGGLFGQPVPGRIHGLPVAGGGGQGL